MFLLQGEGCVSYCRERLCFFYRDKYVFLIVGRRLFLLQGEVCVSYFREKSLSLFRETSVSYCRKMSEFVIVGISWYH